MALADLNVDAAEGTATVRWGTLGKQQIRVQVHHAA